MSKYLGIALAVALGLLALAGWQLRAAWDKLAVQRVALASLNLALKERDKVINANAEREKDDYEGAEKFTSAQALSAYRSGRASCSCGGNGRNTVSPGAPSPGTVSLRDRWQDGAFVPAD